MNSTESPLSVRQGVVIAGRVLSLYFFTLAIANLLSIPGYIASAHHYLKEPTLYQEGYFIKYYLRLIAGSVLRLCVELLFALSFYRSGPKVRRFLLGDSGDSQDTGGRDVSGLQP